MFFGRPRGVGALESLWIAVMAVATKIGWFVGKVSVSDKSRTSFLEANRKRKKSSTQGIPGSHGIPGTICI